MSTNKLQQHWNLNHESLDIFVNIFINILTCFAYIPWLSTGNHKKLPAPFKWPRLCARLLPEGHLELHQGSEISSSPALYKPLGRAVTGSRGKAETMLGGTVSIGFLVWLVVWLPWILLSQKYWVSNHPNWRTHIFQRGGPATNQLLCCFLNQNLE